MDLYYDDYYHMVGNTNEEKTKLFIARMEKKGIDNFSII
jgi:hypothetical protein